MSTTSGGQTVLETVLSEGTDGQYIEVDLIDPITDAAIETSAITEISAVLRSDDTGDVIFGPVSVLPGGSSRGSYPGADGRLRVTFTAADMVPDAGTTRTLQARTLALEVTHSVTKKLRLAVGFPLNDLPSAT